MGSSTAFSAQRQATRFLVCIVLLVVPALSSQNPYGANKTAHHGSRHTRSVESGGSVWDYFPMLPQNIHDPADYEEMPGKTERDAVNPEYRSLCQTIRHKVELRDDEYEYRPPHYFENVCRGPTPNSGDFLSNSNNLMCVYPGFSCVQRSQTIYLTRRRYDSNCWEPFTQTIASSCECMWPVSALGEIAHHF